MHELQGVNSSKEGIAVTVFGKLYDAEDLNGGIADGGT